VKAPNFIISLLRKISKGKFRLVLLEINNSAFRQSVLDLIGNHQYLLPFLIF